MLKARIIPTLTIKDLRLVKSIQFKNHRNIGNYIAAVKVFNARNVDEMIFLDLDAYKEGIKSWLIKEVTKECFMPLTIGGGIKTLEDIRKILKLGADKVSINSHAISFPNFIKRASETFGRQCIIISIDVKKIGNQFIVYSNNGRKNTNLTIEQWAKKAVELGAGEILLTSIDNEGEMKGYDLKLVKRVSNLVSVPIIAKGGAGKAEDFFKVIKAGASAASAASIFQYTHITPDEIKRYIKKLGIEARI